MQEEQEEQDAGALEEAHGVPHELGLVLELNASLLGDALQVFVRLLQLLRHLLHTIARSIFRTHTHPCTHACASVHAGIYARI